MNSLRLNKRIAYQLVVLTIGIAYLLLGSTSFVYAGDDTKSLSGFSYEVIRADNQYNKEVSYYDLRVSPGQKQTIQIKLNNSSENEITIIVGLYGARTNSNGVIQYNKNKIPKDQSLKNDFEDIATAPKEVKLAPNSNQLLSIELKIPKEKFDGYISGAISLEEKDKNQETKTNQGMIRNRFVYQVGVQLSESDTSQIKPEIKFNKVYPGINNFRNAIYIQYSNIKPVYLDNMTFSAFVTKKGEKEPLYEVKKSQMRMAPNTMVDFPIMLNGEKMMPGKYQASALITTQAGGHWEWKKDFTITNLEARKYNDEDLSIEQSSGINWKLIIVIVGIFIILSLGIFCFLTFWNKRKRSAKKKKHRKTSRK